MHSSPEMPAGRTAMFFRPAAKHPFALVGMDDSCGGHNARSKWEKQREKSYPEIVLEAPYDAARTLYGNRQSSAFR
ncbi:hypothetical protein SDC9_77801 [bioreactor metagenome]|uniref:Uncharacterized protein n=1 Tax=bioreactor metagenome TaxID=1076179 RepID=A0A644YSG6_9ZZZZ